MVGWVISRGIVRSLTRPAMDREPWKQDTTYPVEFFGWSNVSEVMVGSLPVLAAQRGRTAYVPLQLIYVWRDNGHNHPKQVTVRMSGFNKCHPISKMAVAHLSRHEVEKMEHECLQTGKYDKGLFFNTADWLSFQPEELELYDRQIGKVVMKIAIPSDLSREYDKGLAVLPLPRVIKPDQKQANHNIGGGSVGINIWIVD